MTKEEFKTVVAKFRVKIKSLAEEAIIIKNEERKAYSHSVRECLYRHRIDIVRREQRHTLLAYAFFLGKKYSELESNPEKAPSIQTINRILKSLSGSSSQDLVSWLN